MVGLSFRFHEKNKLILHFYLPFDRAGQRFYPLLTASIFLCGILIFSPFKYTNTYIDLKDSFFKVNFVGKCKNAVVVADN